MERTFSWTDPRSVAAAARGADGLTFLKSIAGRGRPQAAPIAECLAFELVEVEAGRTVFEVTASEFHYNPIGTVHGGLVATLCDSAIGAAVHSTLERGQGYTSIDLQVRFLKAVTAETGRLRCEGKVVHRGSRIVLGEAQLLDDQGKVYARASSSCLILSG
jgi:uncharacterized protein (TIGR00369 family)